MIYVNMTDKFMSGWGKANNQPAHLSILCDNWEQAEAIEKAAHERPEMVRVATSYQPRRSDGYLTVKKFDEMGAIWKIYYSNKTA